jgi:nucleotide-binding universal stress UspA family protein
MHKQAEALLRETRDAVAPDARIDVETDSSVPRALERVVIREHRDLLVVGSSRRGPEGRVRIGKRTRQLLCDSRCALAVAPRGLSDNTERRLTRVGVGCEGGPESRAALSLAGSVAVAAGAKLLVRGVVDDRLPVVGWSKSGRERMLAMWDELLAPAVESLRENAEGAAKATGADAEVQVLRGSPADALGELCEHVDLLVIGSRRWGAAARALPGSTGETLMHDASCAILVVPRTHRALHPVARSALAAAAQPRPLAPIDRCCARVRVRAVGAFGWRSGRRLKGCSEVHGRCRSHRSGMHSGG